MNRRHHQRWMRKRWLRREQARSTIAQYPGKPDQMCYYQTKHGGGARLHSFHRAVEVSNKYWEQKRVRVKCPVCGRKMWGWAVIGHDADIYYYAIPPHKRKRWWKKKGNKHG